MRWYIGIDNGVTGSIGAISESGQVIYRPMPVKKVLNYTKKKQWLHRIDGDELKILLAECAAGNSFCMLERPFTGRFFKAVMSGIRALEATETVLDMMKIPIQFIDSKEWQKVMLPSGLEKEELKEASLQVGKRFAPHVDWSKFKDADGLLISEYCRRSRQS